MKIPTTVLSKLRYIVNRAESDENRILSMTMRLLNPGNMWFDIETPSTKNMLMDIQRAHFEKDGLTALQIVSQHKIIHSNPKSWILPKIRPAAEETVMAVKPARNDDFQQTKTAKSSNK
jgi:hypothetical protein